MPSTNVFNELCVRTTLLRSILNKLGGMGAVVYVMLCTSGYASI